SSRLVEMSQARSSCASGISHGPTYDRLGLSVGKPLSDMRRFVHDLRAGVGQAGELPPLTLATLRQKMVQLAGEIAQGAVWANAARSHMAQSLRHLPAEKRQDPGSFIG